MRATSGYRLWRRVRDKAFALLVRRDFASWGPNTVIRLPVRLLGEDRIWLGRAVGLEAGCWLEALPGGRIEIGDETRMSGYCVVSAASSIVIGSNVLFGRNVYVGDHTHARGNPDLPIRQQGIAGIRAIRIDDGAWIGQGTVILPGVTIGRNAVVGANSVVRCDVPPHSVAVGAPARVLPKAQQSPTLLRGELGGSG